MNSLSKQGQFLQLSDFNWLGDYCTAPTLRQNINFFSFTRIKYENEKSFWGETIQFGMKLQRDNQHDGKEDMMAFTGKA